MTTLDARLLRLISPPPPVYLHFCDGCGETMEVSYPEDFSAHCPECSKRITENRIFRHVGDPPIVCWINRP